MISKQDTCNIISSPLHYLHPKHCHTVLSIPMSCKSKCVFTIIVVNIAFLISYVRIVHWESQPTLVETRGDGRGSLNLGLPAPNVFQPIDNDEAWLYSAYFDHVSEQAGNPKIRVFGIARKNLLKTVYCSISTENSSLTITSALKMMPDLHGIRVPAAHVECSIPKSVRPTFVSISFQTKEKPTNRLQVQYPGPLVRNFTVCYSALHNNYSMLSQLMQSIEINRILGAEHFVVYNNSVSTQVDKVLQRYKDDGLLTVMDWQLPTDKSHYFGQIAAINDCFYRNRNSSRFIVVVDTDEFIVPRNHYSWAETIASLSPQEADISEFSKSSVQNKGDTLTGCFLARSSYFYINTSWDFLSPTANFTQEERDNTIKYKFLALSNFNRSIQIFPPHDRCKYIARPKLVYNAGIHYVMTSTDGKACHNVNPNVALVHHYRMPHVPGLHVPNVLDTSLLKFKTRLYHSLMEQYRRYELL